MKYFLMLICFCFSMSLSAAQINDRGQAKLYFTSNDVEVSDNVIYLHLDSHLIETNTIRTDQEGLYIFEHDIISYEAASEKMWKCPYCWRWWPIGQRCGNPECPTNQW